MTIVIDIIAYIIKRLQRRRYITTALQSEDVPGLQFSHAAGCYRRGFMLVLSHPDPTVQIVYTLDGSEPDLRNLNGTTFSYKNHYPEKPGDPFGEYHEAKYISFVYSSPIEVVDRSREPNQLSNKASTVQRNPDYFPVKPVPKCTVVKAVAFKDGEQLGAVQVRTYVVGIPARGRNLPLWLITIPEEDLFDYEKGIYTAGSGFDAWRRQNPDDDGKAFGENYRGRGPAFIRPAHLEIIEPGRSCVVLSKRFACSIYGASSRRQPIKSLFLQFETSADPDRSIGYNPFSGMYEDGSSLSATDFQHLMMRTGGGNLNYLNDHCAHLIMAPLFPGVQRGCNVVHYVNGEYFGLVQVREYQDPCHIARNFGVGADNVIILNGVWGSGQSDRVEVGTEEDLSLYRQMYTYVTETDMTTDAARVRVEDMLDIENYFNYMIMFIFFANGDWRGKKHFRLWRARVKCDDRYGDTRWRVMVWDFDDRRWGGGRKNYVETVLHPEGGGDARPFGHPDRTAFFRGLMDNPRLRNRFINQFADHLNTVFLPDRVEHIVKMVMRELKPHLRSYEIRWKRQPVPPDCYKDYLRFARHRPRFQREHLMKCFNLGGLCNIRIKVAGVLGARIRLNGIDIVPGYPGIGTKPYPWVGTYFKNVSIRLEALPVSGSDFDHWSVVSQDGVLNTSYEQSAFEINPVTDLVITAKYR